MAGVALFKVLVDGASCHGGSGKYPPKGKWTKPISEPSCCKSGYHLTSDPLRWWQPRATLWLAEGRSPLHGDNSDKAAFRSVRLVEKVTPKWDLLVMFPRVRAFLAASARSLDAKANISWANLSEANLSLANLSEANLSGVSLSRANLSGASLSGASLSRANLSEANLSRANLSWANLSGASLSGANLSEANLSLANLSEANLSWANLSEANLSGANLSEANLSGACWPGEVLPGWKLNETGRLVKED